MSRWFRTRAARRCLGWGICAVTFAGFIIQLGGLWFLLAALTFLVIGGMLTVAVIVFDQWVEGGED
jgi:hypothetical protein